jgi:hypothetical protein
MTANKISTARSPDRDRAAINVYKSLAPAYATFGLGLSYAVNWRAHQEIVRLNVACVGNKHHYSSVANGNMVCSPAANTAKCLAVRRRGRLRLRAAGAFAVALVLFRQWKLGQPRFASNRPVLIGWNKLIRSVERSEMNFHLVIELRKHG